VLTLDEHVGDTTEVIDILVNQSPEGLEVLGRSSTHTYDGTWKVQAENGTDGYHVIATHWNYAAISSRRSTVFAKLGVRSTSDLAALRR
jgi:benzoate/toluate 1,2-dioxygenase subunit alpha